MKKIIVLLLAVVGISISAYSSTPLSCPIYGASGATVTLLQKGGQADKLGRIDCNVAVDNYHKDSNKLRSLTVFVEVRDEDTGCVVKRQQITVWIAANSPSATTICYVDGLKPNHDYLFNINSAKTCE